jgi:hypothetical protein
LRPQQASFTFVLLTTEILQIGIGKNLAISIFMCYAKVNNIKSIGDKSFVDMEGKMSHFRSVKIGVVTLFFSIFFITTLPESTRAAVSTCYQVSKAGITEVNGLYYEAGFHNGKPIYQHESLGYFISYDAFGYGNEWNLTTAIGGGLDLYFKQSQTFNPPNGYWYQGLNGVYPGATVKAIPCSDEETEVAVFDLVGGRRQDNSVRSSGFFTPASFVNGTITIWKIPAEFAPHRTQISMYGNVSKVEIEDLQGQTYTKFKSLNYIYFNLTNETAKLWASGVLGVYKHTLNGRKWIPIDTYFVDAGDYGRLAALMYGPGYYVLGSSNNAK